MNNRDIQQLLNKLWNIGATYLTKGLKTYNLRPNRVNNLTVWVHRQNDYKRLTNHKILTEFLPVVIQSIKSVEWHELLW